MDRVGTIAVEASDGIGWLTIDNPARRNAMTLEMWQQLARAMDCFEQDDVVRVVVIHGAGGRAFMSGADISQFETRRRDADHALAYTKIQDVGRASVERFTKPLIAAISGFCVGGGLSVACMADLRVASDDAVFAIPAARLGIAYGFESLGRLVSLVGPSVAKDMLFTARRLDAQEALRVGLLSRVVAPEALEETVREFARRIADNAPLSIRAAKLGVDHWMRPPATREMTAIEAAARACLDSADYAEGRRAFLEKRTPVFRGV